MSLPPLSPHSLGPGTSAPASPSPSPQNKMKKKRNRKIPRRPVITATAAAVAPRGTKGTFRAVRCLFRSLSISRPSPCRFPSPLLPRAAPRPSRSPCSRTTGTLFGHRKARISLAIQDTPHSPSPSLLLELAVPTGKFMQEMAADHLRVALECDKRNLPDISDGAVNVPSRLLDEPLWTAYVNGRKAGYAVRRDPTDDDLAVARLLRTVSAGAGVIPADVVGDGREGEGDLAYMRAHFDRVVGGKDYESFYMLNPDGHNGPELCIFFIRI